MSKITVRPAESAGLAPIAAIYADAVHTSVATFYIEEPAHAYWQAKLDSTAVGDHFMVASSPSRRFRCGATESGQQCTAPQARLH